MKGPTHSWVALSALIAASVLPAHAANDSADFYNKKQITLVVGYGPGAGYDIYARLIARYLEKYVAGNPRFVVQNMDGAGTLRATNWLYNAAPKDGTYIGMVSGNIPLNEALKMNGVQYETAKFNWIGNPDSANRTTIVMASSGIASIDDLKKNGDKAICGGPGATTQSIQFPQIMNNLLGSKMRIIAGYPDGNSVSLAMERGEVNCRAGNSWAGVKAGSPDWIKNKTINVIMQWGLDTNPEVDAYMGHHVPLALEYARDADDRGAIGLLQSSVTVGRPFIAPPGVPEERVAALRRAFDAVMVDKQFLAEADKLQLDINPLSGERLQQLTEDIANAKKSVLDRAQQLSELKDVGK